METINSPKNLQMLEDKIFELSKARQRENATLSLLTSEYKKTKNAISNILDCMEQGIATESTKERLQTLENKKYLFIQQILLLKAQTQLQLTKEDIHERITSAIRKKPLQMINLLVKEVRMKNEKIQIDFKYTDKKGPDEDNRWDFCYYTTNKTYIVDNHTFKSTPTEYSVKVELYI